MTNHSPEFIKARNDFQNWYESHSEDIQNLIDEIADRTTFILEEDVYDAFVIELAKHGIDDTSDFIDSFHKESEGIGDEVKAEFAKWFLDECGFEVAPGFNGLKVWNENLLKDFMAIELIGNSYFLRISDTLKFSDL